MCGFAFGCHAQARPKMETTTAVWTRWWCRKARDRRVVCDKNVCDRGIRDRMVCDRVRVGSVIRRRLRECVGDDTAGLSIGRYALRMYICMTMSAMSTIGNVTMSNSTTNW